MAETGSAVPPGWYSDQAQQLRWWMASSGGPPHPPNRGSRETRYRQELWMRFSGSGVLPDFKLRVSSPPSAVCGR